MTLRDPRMLPPVLALLCLAAATTARADEPTTTSKEILKVQESVVGEPIVLPGGPGQIRSVIVTIPAGQATPRHDHGGTTLCVYVLEGEVTVEYEGKGKKVFRKGQSFVEASRVPHVASNTGKGVARTLAVYVEGAPAAR